MNNSALMAITLLGGLLSATLSALPLLNIPGLVFFSYLTCLPLFLVGLSLGVRPLLGAGLLASVLLLLFEGPYLAGEYFVLSFLGPAFIVSRTLLKRKKKSGEVVWYPSSLLLRDMTLAAGFVMLMALAVYLYLTQGGDPHLILKPLLNTFDPQGHLKEAESLILKILPFLPGVFAFSWSVMMLLNAVLAQGLLIRFNRNLRPAPSSSNLNVPNGFSIVFGLSLLLSYIGVGSLEILAKNAAFVLVFPFFLVGLSLVHIWIHRTAYPTAGLVIFYSLLLLLFWPFLIVILLGILKPWIEKSISPN